MALAAALSSAAWATETVTYTYDANGRLVKAVHTGTVNNGSQSAISYDATDNRSTFVSGTGVGVLSVADTTASEGSALNFVVTRTGDASTAVSANYGTANGSATAGADYTATSGTVNFAVGETTKTISVPTIDDSTPEPAETLFLNLSAPGGGASISRAQATGTIAANDVTAITFSVANAPTVTEGGALVFTVTKNGSTYLSTSVSYATANGTATAGSDYTATSGTLTFAGGETSKTVSVATIDDLATESPETVLLNLSSPSGGTISVGQASGTINDNDTGPVTALNPALNYDQDTVNAIPVATLVIVNGNSVRITGFSVPSGKGTASIAGDGQSVTYTAEHVGPSDPCTPAPKDTFSVPYSVQNTGTGATTSGTATFTVKGVKGSGRCT